MIPLNRIMRILVFFDLPTLTKQDKKIYSQFRKFLIQDGYYMIQFSVYCRICNSMGKFRHHTKMLKNHVPANSNIRCLRITEKQFLDMTYIWGKILAQEKKVNNKQMLIF